MHLFSDKLSFFKGKNGTLLKQGLHGLEKECLRVNQKKRLAQTSHPSFLGSPFTHPDYSTDFGEAQLEFVTPPYPKIEGVFEHLENLHLFIHHGLSGESLWPMSTPCHLPDLDKIELANYGTTKNAYEKWLYRKGLSYRYGKAMQLLSGIHYSFSFSDFFWKVYHSELNSKQSLDAYTTDQYLHLIRNFLRMGWICSYLFGASPIVDKSYLSGPNPHIKVCSENSCYAPYATSIRMSHLGYFSQIQCQNAVSFNKLDDYLRDLKYMLNTPSKDFEQIGEFYNQKRIQMNTNILQIEAEHYSRIRPKAKEDRGLRPLEALKTGIGYVESRILDLNPYCPNGLDLDTLYFMHLFFVYCLFKESPFIEKPERKTLFENQNKVALSGRKKGLKLTHSFNRKQISIENWSLEICEGLEEIATLFDQGDTTKRYTKALNKQLKKIKDPTLTPSARILNTLLEKKESYEDFSFKKAKAHQKYFKAKSLSQKLKSEYRKKAEESLEKLSILEEKEDTVLPGYEDLEFSTQMLLKEAMKQKIDFEILDRKENFICLIQGEHKEWIKQATQTRLDPLIAYFLMENKQVTKELLKNEGLEVPKGGLYSSLKEARDAYPLFEKSKVVVKPNLANMGQGISFVEPHNKKHYLDALKTASKFKHQLLVEEYFEGEEYRFLVIQNKVVAICKRMPAHLTGDGTHSIEELINLKNKKNIDRAHFQKPLKITQREEKQILDQGFKLESVPKKGQVIFLMQNSNVSTGGESIDFTDQMPKFYQEAAVQAAYSAQAQICGVDILIESLKKKPTSKLYKIIELNFNPALYLHRFPAQGKKRYVEKEILKALGFSGSWK